MLADLHLTRVIAATARATCQWLASRAKGAGVARAGTVAGAPSPAALVVSRGPFHTKNSKKTRMVVFALFSLVIAEQFFVA
jgi:hypothetical protein